MAKPTICFDMDGTLVDTAPDLVGALNFVLQKHGFEAVDTHIAKTLIGQGAGAMIKGGLDLIDHDVSPDMLRIMEDDFDHHYLSHHAVLSSVFYGTPQALSDLKDAGYNLVVCTNTGKALARIILKEFGLIDFFCGICGGDTTPYKKPDPRPLLHAIELAKGDVSHAIMVGDSETDIATAKNAQIPVIAFDFGYSKTPVAQLNPDLVLSNYQSLTASVETLQI